ncbi:rhodanese-related sulfurtransferase [Candidatus Pacearchaeota archaeon]|nr:rhodanese-related sulfurtransferase [Candidatus Pacearchaeota archaeon]
MNNVKVLLFYKYVNIENPVEFKKKHLLECEDLGLLGRILIAKEGINGSVSGTRGQTENYKQILKKDKRFSDIEFKEDDAIMPPFKKIVIKVKSEIIKFQQDVDLNSKGKHISSEEFLDLYNSGEDVVILDARNEYEWQVGKFKNAVTLPIENFTEFPKAVEKLEKLKDKKVVMYCTGGIRCEKASAYLIQEGFKDVSQLHGGILTFGKKYPDSVWEGTCFVFDKRLKSDINMKSGPITKCRHCKTKCDQYRNCRVPECNDLFVICPNCDIKFQGCCSKECWKKIIIQSNKIQN